MQYSTGCIFFLVHYHSWFLKAVERKHLNNLKYLSNFESYARLILLALPHRKYTSFSTIDNSNRSEDKVQKPAVTQQIKIRSQPLFQLLTATNKFCNHTKL